MKEVRVLVSITGIIGDDSDDMRNAIVQFIKDNGLAGQWIIFTTSDPRAILEGELLGKATGEDFSREFFGQFKPEYTVREPVDVLQYNICVRTDPTCKLAICLVSQSFMWACLCVSYHQDVKLEPGDALFWPDYRGETKIEWPNFWGYFHQKHQTENC